jgi:hypothetical protein
VDVTPGRVVVEVDDVPVNEIRTPADSGKRIGLQMEKAPIEFRNIRIVPDNP